MSTPSAANNPGHIRFLVSCIRHATNGKVDFDEVRKELDIVTKAAAAKRYERLLKQYPADGGSEADCATKKRKAPAAAKGEAKKAKIGGKKSAAKVKEEEIKEEDASSDALESATAEVKPEEKLEDSEA